MKKKSLFFVLIISTFMSGCVTSLHPLFTKNDLITDKNLVGTWLQQDGEDIAVWKFEKYQKGMFGMFSEKSYTLTYFEDSVPAKFSVHLTKLGNHVFFDLYPIEVDNVNPLAELCLLPVHVFFKAKITNNQVELKMFNYKWLSKLFEENRIRISHELVGPHEMITLTASTKELQKFVIKYADDANAFEDEPAILKRQI